MNIISLGLKTALIITLGFGVGVAPPPPPPPPPENFFGEHADRGPRLPVFAPINLTGSTGQGAQSVSGRFAVRWELVGATAQAAQFDEGVLEVAQTVGIETAQVNAVAGHIGVRIVTSVRTGQRQTVDGRADVSMIVKVESGVTQAPTYDGPSWERDPLGIYDA